MFYLQSVKLGAFTPLNSLLTCVALSRSPAELSGTSSVLFKLFFFFFLLLSVVSFVSVCKTEEVKDDAESKADGGEDRDESSKVRKKFSRDATLAFKKKMSFTLSLFFFFSSHTLNNQPEIRFTPAWTHHLRSSL